MSYLAFIIREPSFRSVFLLSFMILSDSKNKLVKYRENIAEHREIIEVNRGNNCYHYCLHLPPGLSLPEVTGSRGTAAGFFYCPALLLGHKNLFLLSGLQYASCLRIFNVYGFLLHKRVPFYLNICLNCRIFPQSRTLEAHLKLL